MSVVQERYAVSISGYGVVTVYGDNEYQLIKVVKNFFERGEVSSCTELLSALEILRKRRSIHIAGVLDEKLAKVIGSGACPDLK